MDMGQLLTAIIGGIATITAALLPLYLQKRRGRDISRLLRATPDPIARVLAALALGMAVTLAVLSLLERSKEENSSIVFDLMPYQGWQGPEVAVSKGEHLCVSASGEVHLGSGHITNMLQMIKPIVMRYRDPNDSLGVFLDEIPPLADEDLNSLNFFRRHWHGPQGRHVTDEMLDTSRIHEDAPWGALLATVIGTPPSSLLSQADPHRVLKENGIPCSDITLVGGQEISITASRSGWLVFIVNDASPSKHSTDRRSRDLYSALERASQQMNSKRHRIESTQIPLIWFQDNVGRYQIQIERRNCVKD